MVTVIMSCDNDDNQDDLFEPIVINDNDINIQLGILVFIVIVD